ncbi:MAG: dihydrofolate reductase family protein [Clostridia bacterium]|nr:dihydrofolate reductase family protein [Clostridia bacterium]
MDRPYIVCHMVTSIDGKVTGEFLEQPVSQDSIKLYYEINRTLPSNGFICGRVTMEGSFTHGWYPDLTAYAPQKTVDFIPEHRSGFYAVAFDTNGRLGWRSGCIVDEDSGYDGAQIVEVLSENVDPRYLGYLKSQGIAYVFAGQETIDVTVALNKLSTLLGAETLLLEGGSIINGAFQRADVIDELSIVIAPVVADAVDKPLFTVSTFAEFELTDVKRVNGTVVLNYTRKSNVR